MNIDFFIKNKGNSITVKFKDGRTEPICIFDVIGNDIIYVNNSVLQNINSKPINEQHEIIKYVKNHSKFNINDVF